MRLYNYFSLMVCFLGVSSKVSAADWVLEIDSNNIQVYTKHTPTSLIRSFKGEMIIKATPKEIANFFDDVDNYQKWNDGTVLVTLLEQPTRNSKVIYQVQSIPIIKDRDVVVFGQLTQDPKTYGIKIMLKATPDRLPEKPEYVRVRQFDVLWQFTLIGDGKMKVVIEGSIDPSGSVPAALFNQFVADTPYRSMLNMSKIDFSKYSQPPLIDDGVVNP